MGNKHNHIGETYFLDSLESEQSSYEESTDDEISDDEDLENLDDENLYPNGRFETEQVRAVALNRKLNAPPLPTPDNSRIEEDVDYPDDGDDDLHDQDMPVASSTQLDNIDPLLFTNRASSSSVPKLTFNQLLEKRREQKKGLSSKVVGSEILSNGSVSLADDLNQAPMTPDYTYDYEPGGDEYEAGCDGSEEGGEDDEGGGADIMSPDYTADYEPGGDEYEAGSVGSEEGGEDDEGGGAGIEEAGVDIEVSEDISEGREDGEGGGDDMEEVGADIEVSDDNTEAEHIASGDGESGLIGNQITDITTPVQQPINSALPTTIEEDTREYPRITELGDDRKIYLIETKYKGLKKFVFIHGLLVNEERKIIRTSKEFFKHNTTLRGLVQARGDRILTFEEIHNQKSRLFAFNHPVLFEYADSKFFHTKFVSESGVTSRTLVTAPKLGERYAMVEGCEVSTGHNRSFVVYLQRNTEGNHRDFSFNIPDTRTEHTISYLEDEFQGYIFENDDIDYLLKGSTSDRIEEGQRIYTMIYNSVMKDESSKNVRAPSFHFRNDPDMFYRRHKHHTLKNYSRYFGHFYSLLHCYRSFAFVRDTCSLTCEELIDLIVEASNDRVRAERIINLFVYFNSGDGTTFLRTLLFGFFRKFKSNGFCNNQTILVKLAVLQNIYKYCIFLTCGEDEVHKFSTGRDWNKDNKGYYLLYLMHKALMKVKYEGVINVEASDSPGKCYVNGVPVDKSYFAQVYFKSIESYKTNFQQICNITKSQVLIHENYDQFIPTAINDYSSVCLGGSFDNGRFDHIGLDEYQKKDLLKIIDNMTKALVSMVYVSSANSYRSTELLWLNFQADSYEDRDLVFRDGLVLVQLSYNKNRSHKRRLRITTRGVSECIIAHVTIVRGLLIRILEDDFPTIKEIRFDSQALRDPDVLKEVFYKKFLFVTSEGSFVSLPQLYSFQAKILGIKMREVLKIRTLRQAVAYFIRFEMERRQEYLNAIAKRIDETQAGHNSETGFGHYGAQMNGNESMHFTDDIELTRGYFNSFFEFIGIATLSPQGKLLELNEPEKIPTDFNQLRYLGTEDIQAAAEQVYKNFMFRDANQALAVTDIAYGDAVDRFIMAPTGYGKTLLFTIPLIAFKLRHQQNPTSHKRVLSIILVPYTFLLYDLVDRLSPYLAVQSVKEYYHFKPQTDVMVGVYNEFVKPEFNQFIKNFNLRFSKTNVLGLVVFDEIHSLLQEFKFRKFRNYADGNLELFWKRLYVSATVGRNFDSDLTNKLKVATPRTLNFVSRVPNDGIFQLILPVQTNAVVDKMIIATIRNFLNYKPEEDGIILLYFGSKTKLDRKMELLKGHFEEHLFVKLTGETENKREEFNKLRTGKKILMATRVASVGIDVNMNLVVFWSMMPAKMEFIQTTGRTRNFGVCLIARTPRPEEARDELNELEKTDEPLDPNKCVTFQLAEHYHLKYPGHYNCCSVEVRHPDKNPELEKLVSLIEFPADLTPPIIEQSISNKRRKIVAVEENDIIEDGNDDVGATDSLSDGEINHMEPQPITNNIERLPINPENSDVQSESTDVDSRLEESRRREEDLLIRRRQALEPLFGAVDEVIEKYDHLLKPFTYSYMEGVLRSILGPEKEDICRECLLHVALCRDKPSSFEECGYAEKMVRVISVLMMVGLLRQDQVIEYRGNGEGLKILRIVRDNKDRLLTMMKEYEYNLKNKLLKSYVIPGTTYLSILYQRALSNLFYKEKLNPVFFTEFIRDGKKHKMVPGVDLKDSFIADINKTKFNEFGRYLGFAAWFPTILFMYTPCNGCGNNHSNQNLRSNVTNGRNGSGSIADNCPFGIYFKIIFFVIYHDTNFAKYFQGLFITPCFQHWLERIGDRVYGDHYHKMLLVRIILDSPHARWMVQK